MNNKTKNHRQSNIEVLRILSMFFVLLIHTCSISLGPLTHTDFVNETSDSFIRVLLTAFSEVCVDVFVLISGWFGIKPKSQSLCNFIYQIVFFFIITSIMVKYIFGIDFSWGGLVWQTFFQHSSYWFVVAYLILYALSPVLNAFIENNSRQTIGRVIIMLFICQTIFGWIGWRPYYSSGYNPLSFILLYLLARYVHIFTPQWGNMRKSYYLLSYMLISLLGALSVFGIGYYFNNESFYNAVYGRWASYTSPFNIISALSLLLFFSKFRFHNRIVNFVAASSFSAYIFHCHPIFLESIYKGIVVKIHVLFTPPLWAYAVSTIFAIIVFGFAVMIDQVRKLSWGYVNNKWLKRIKQ